MTALLPAAARVYSDPAEVLSTLADVQLTPRLSVRRIATVSWAEVYARYVTPVPIASWRSPR